MAADRTIADALASLGDTADVVAASLRKAGIRGKPRAARFLGPIVRFVAPHVTPDTINLGIRNPGMLRLSFRSGQKLDMVLPRAVIEFLVAFNAGKYPDLQLFRD